MAQEGRSNYVNIPTCHIVCPTHRKQGVLKLKIVNKHYYWYIMHWWQKAPCLYYLGSAKIAKYFEIIKQTTTEQELFSKIQQNIAILADLDDDKDKARIATELAVLEIAGGIVHA